jgi:hypothetical protein
MQRAVRAMPQATCRKQEINRRFSTPVGKRANGTGSPNRVIARSGRVFFGRLCRVRRKSQFMRTVFFALCPRPYRAQARGIRQSGNDGRDLSGSDYPRRSGWLRRTSALTSADKRDFRHELHCPRRDCHLCPTCQGLVSTTVGAGPHWHGGRHPAWLCRPGAW